MIHHLNDNKLSIILNKVNEIKNPEPADTRVQVTLKNSSSPNSSDLLVSLKHVSNGTVPVRSKVPVQVYKSEPSATEKTSAYKIPASTSHESLASVLP